MMKAIRILATLIICLAVAADTAGGVGCVDYADYMHWIGGLGGPPLEGHGLEISGGLAYHTNGELWYDCNDKGCWAISEGVLRILDISDPTSPTLLGSVELDAIAWDVALSGNYAFVAFGDSGLKVIDVSNPSAPTIVAGFPIADEPRDLTLVGNTLFLVAGTVGLLALDVSNPLAPALLGTDDTPGRALGLAVQGNLAFVADSSGGLRIVDISDPMAPAVVGTAPIADNVRDVAVDGPLAFLTGPTGLHVVDTADPTMPQAVGFTPMPARHVLSPTGSGRAYVSAEVGWVNVVDVSVPAAPTVVARIEIPGHARDLRIEGGLLYVGGNGVQVVQLQNSLNPATIGSLDMPGTAVNVTVQGDYAYVALGAAGVRVVDISDPSAPVGVAFLPVSRDGRAVAVSGTHAYVADGDWGLRVYDVSNPASPAGLTRVLSWDYSWDVAASGNYVYLADGSGGLRVFNVSNPASPVQVGWLSGSAFALVLRGDYVYAALGNFTIVDVSDPTSPTIAGFLPGGGPRVALLGSHAYVASTVVVLGIRAIDVSTPSLPAFVGGGTSTGQSPAGMATLGGFVYLADDESGLQVFDVTDPTSPRLVGTLPTPDCAQAVAIGDGFACIAADSAGLVIAPLHCPSAVGVDPDLSGDPLLTSRVALDPAIPNPFRNRTNVRFTISAERPVSVTVFDATGRLVRTILSGRALPRGEHVVSWDGLNDRGLSAASGSYVLRLEVGEERRTQKIVRLR